MSEYRLEKVDEKCFEVYKDGQFAYNIRFKSKAWSCDCPARKECKHLKMLPAEVLVKRYLREAIDAAYLAMVPWLFPYRHQIVGSYRRGKADSKDLDIIILMPEKEFDQLRMSFTHSVKGFVLISGGSTKFHGTMCGIPCDIDRIDDPNHWAAHLLYRTGPAELNIKMRQLAKEKGFVLNERVEARSEEDIFKMVGMDYISPEKRG